MKNEKSFWLEICVYDKVGGSASFDLSSIEFSSAVKSLIFFLIMKTDGPVNVSPTPSIFNWECWTKMLVCLLDCLLFRVFLNETFIKTQIYFSEGWMQRVSRADRHILWEKSRNSHSSIRIFRQNVNKYFLFFENQF